MIRHHVVVSTIAKDNVCEARFPLLSACHLELAVEDSQRLPDRSRDEVGGGLWGSVQGKGYFWERIWGVPLYPMGTLRRTCATVPQPSKLRFGVVRAVGRGIAVLDGGPRRAREEEVWGFVLHFHNGKYH